MAQLFHILSPCQQNTTLVSVFQHFHVREIISGYKKGKYTKLYIVSHLSVMTCFKTNCIKICMWHISHFFHIKEQIHQHKYNDAKLSCDNFHKTIAHTFLLKWQNKTMHSMSGWGKADTFSLVFRKRACLLKAKKHMQSVKFRNKEPRIGNSGLEETGTYITICLETGRDTWNPWSCR